MQQVVELLVLLCLEVFYGELMMFGTKGSCEGSACWMHLPSSRTQNHRIMESGKSSKIIRSNHPATSNTAHSPVQLEALPSSQHPGSSSLCCGHLKSQSGIQSHLDGMRRCPMETRCPRSTVSPHLCWAI